MNLSTLFTTHAYAQTLIVIVLINPYVNIPVWLNSQHIVL